MFVNLMLPYKNWVVCETKTRERVMPVGAGGILYPINVLQKYKRPDFMSVAPTTDDIFFYSILCNKCSYTYCSKYNFISLGRLLNKNNNLFKNNLVSFNDKSVNLLLK
jgi:hypothetical protein